MSLGKVNKNLVSATSVPVSKISEKLSPEKSSSVWQQVKSKIEQCSKSASNFVRNHKQEIKVGAAGTTAVSLLAGAFFAIRKSIGGAKKETPVVKVEPKLEEVNKALPKTFAEARVYAEAKCKELTERAWKKLDEKVLSTDKFKEIKASVQKKFDLNSITKEKIWELVKQNKKKVAVAAGVLAGVATVVVAKKVFGGQKPVQLKFPKVAEIRNGKKQIRCKYPTLDPQDKPDTSCSSPDASLASGTLGGKRQSNLRRSLSSPDMGIAYGASSPKPSGNSRREVGQITSPPQLRDLNATVDSTKQGYPTQPDAALPNNPGASSIDLIGSRVDL